MIRSVNIAASFVIIYLSGLLLITGRGILMPIIIAMFIWYFLNAIYRVISHLPKVGTHLPKAVSVLLTMIFVMGLGYAIVSIISNNVADVIQASARYQDHIQVIIANLQKKLHFQSALQLNTLLGEWSLQPFLVGIYGVFTSITSSAILIGLYVVFLFVEQHFFTTKLNALFPQRTHQALVHNILGHIIQDTQSYLGLKTFLSLITACASWLIMVSVHLDFSAFWALLIFFLNFIPNIGAIIATAFPVLLAFVQFQTPLPCFIIAGGIILVQFVIGNLIEPRFLSKSLNLSPLVILIALAFWGSVWGILGMFLSVPITVMMMIIFAHFNATRPIAILLSQDGCIQKTYEKL
ncbi:MAG: AI-2E family transporter [Methylococcales bacterium]|nr:AI-2E family transporter [Methylococcales bacterium]